MTQTRMVHDPLFATTHDGAFHLAGSRCRACSRETFPRSPGCPACGSADLEEVVLPSTGTLWGWTAVTAAPPGYQGEVPFGFGVVELTNGLRVITRLTESDPARLERGMAMHLVADALSTDDDGTVVLTYAFAPAPSRQAGATGS